MTTADTHSLLLIHADGDTRHRLAAQLDLDGYTVHEAPTRPPRALG